jgi:hypothetical protein
MSGFIDTFAFLYQSVSKEWRESILKDLNPYVIRAVDNGFYSIIDTLIKLQIPIARDLLFYTCEKGSLKYTKILHLSGMEFTREEFHTACLHNRVNIVKYILRTTPNIAQNE